MNALYTDVTHTHTHKTKAVKNKHMFHSSQLSLHTDE